MTASGASSTEAGAVTPGRLTAGKTASPPGRTIRLPIRRARPFICAMRKRRGSGPRPPAPAGADAACQIRHGAGYTKWRRNSHGLEQELLIFVPPDRPGEGDTTAAAQPVAAWAPPDGHLLRRMAAGCAPSVALPACGVRLRSRTPRRYWHAIRGTGFRRPRGVSDVEPFRTTASPRIVTISSVGKAVWTNPPGCSPGTWRTRSSPARIPAPPPGASRDRWRGANGGGCVRPRPGSGSRARGGVGANIASGGVRRIAAWRR